MVDPHDSLSHPAGVSDTQAESATCLDPELFANFSIPNWFGVESPESTKDNPLCCLRFTWHPRGKSTQLRWKYNKL
ncbi:TBCC domain-containing protein 1-like [Iris pallida]|uniref:TBCC domain-containing protein 1-like n=1 Tax=Iris pallida TaxID=29817 RepID=A0AAX6GLN7_IRIPA|nr:TBCC domain-containing protein 1-like [Iris pallida]